MSPKTTLRHFTMTLFSATHGLTILILIIIGGLLIHFGRRQKIGPRFCLALICLLVYPINQLAFSTLSQRLPLDNIIPGHLCDIAAFTAGFALLTKRPLLCELTYCWGLAGTLQGLITPNLAYNFPHPVFFSFFIQHGVIVIAALYLPLAMDWKPRPGTVIRIFIWNQIYFILALIANFSLGTNFGFLLEKPSTASLLDQLGDWPIYLFWLQILATALVILLLLPFSKSINIWRLSRIGVSETHE